MGAPGVTTRPLGRGALAGTRLCGPDNETMRVLVGTRSEMPVRTNNGVTLAKEEGAIKMLDRALDRWEGAAETIIMTLEGTRMRMVLQRITFEEGAINTKRMVGVGRQMRTTPMELMLPPGGAPLPTFSTPTTGSSAASGIFYKNSQVHAPRTK